MMVKTPFALVHVCYISHVSCRRGRFVHIRKLSKSYIARRVDGMVGGRRGVNWGSTTGARSRVKFISDVLHGNMY